MKVSYVIAGTMMLMATPALADGPECRLRILSAVTDDVGNTWQPGKVLPVDIQRVDGKGVSFCAHGGSCIPRMSGNALASRLIDCRKGASIGGGDYSLIRLRHRSSAKQSALRPTS